MCKSGRTVDGNMMQPNSTCISSGINLLHRGPLQVTWTLQDQLPYRVATQPALSPIMIPCHMESSCPALPSGLYLEKHAIHTANEMHPLQHLLCQWHAPTGTTRDIHLLESDDDAPPAALSIQLSRAMYRDHRACKDHTSVPIPSDNVIWLPYNQAQEVPQIRWEKYQIVSLICHLGEDMHSGHYVTYRLGCP